MPNTVRFILLLLARTRTCEQLYTDHGHDQKGQIPAQTDN